ncbi:MULTISPECIES: lamin tail domain-containing protein [unclassified Streptomyces]|uniref:lamin tail domain-containing protein n=1 Tax=unclassified Streptomyces TaxID=2593676 RepID=UPI0011A5BC7E|nr:lamin tail domain-containing protein [Streptomyces sp. BK340]TVZ95016.1 lamin tail-like protein [Streptomyces sp. BK340]
MKTYPVLVAAAVVAAGALATAPAHAATDPKTVHFGGWQYDSPGSDTRSNTSLNNEWINIHNGTSSAVQLKGWSVEDTAGHRYVLPSYRIGAGRTVKLHTGRGTNTAGHLYWGSGNYIWNNTQDMAFLFKPNGYDFKSCFAGHDFDDPNPYNCHNES